MSALFNEYQVNHVSMDGFQVVESGYFQKQQGPQMTLWKNAVQFNAMTYQVLSNCECVKLLLNSKTRQILVHPCPSNDPDSIKWLKEPAAPKTTKILCEPLTRQLFEGWNWEPAYHYRSTGVLVQSDDRLMLLFDFKKPEVWDKMKRVQTAK